MSSQINNLRRLRFELGDRSLGDMATILEVSLPVYHHAELYNRFSVRLLMKMQVCFSITLEQARGLCEGKLSESDVVEIAKRYLERGAEKCV